MKPPVMDCDTFCAQVIRYQDALFRTAKAILYNDQDAEDAVQEAICSAFAHRDSLREADKFKPWLLRIVTNQCYEVCRRRRPSVDLAEVEDSLPALQQDQVQSMDLWRAVMALGDDLRVTVTLFYYEGFSIREISSIQGISEAAVKTRLSRARMRLKRLLKEA